MVSFQPWTYPRGAQMRAEGHHPYEARTLPTGEVGDSVTEEGRLCYPQYPLLQAPDPMGTCSSHPRKPSTTLLCSYSHSPPHTQPDFLNYCIYMF